MALNQQLHFLTRRSLYLVKLGGTLSDVLDQLRPSTHGGRWGVFQAVNHDGVYLRYRNRTITDRGVRGNTTGLYKQGPYQSFID